MQARPEEEVVAEAGVDFKQELEQMVTNHAEDINLVRCQGLMVDDISDFLFTTLYQRHSS